MNSKMRKTLKRETLHEGFTARDQVSMSSPPASLSCKNANVLNLICALLWKLKLIQK
jgi:hypothetical protein